MTPSERRDALHTYMLDNCGGDTDWDKVEAAIQAAEREAWDGGVAEGMMRGVHPRRKRQTYDDWRRDRE